MNFISALDEEIRSLRQSLDNDPRYIKLKELERVRSLYGEEPDAPRATPQTVTAMVPVTLAEYHTGMRGRRRMSPERQSAIDEVHQFLQGKVEPTKTADLLAHLEKKGITLGGSDPMNNLSALISMSAGFKAHGRSGWTLKTNEAAGSPSESGPAASKPALQSAQ